MSEETDKLEIKISYLEGQLDELNGVIIDQEKSIALMERRTEALEKKVEDLIEVSGPARPQRKPPHY